MHTYIHTYKFTSTQKDSSYFGHGSYAKLDLCPYKCMHVCMYVCMYVWLYVQYVCMGCVPNISQHSSAT